MEYSVSHHGDQTDHPHQCGRGRGFQADDRPGRPARAAHWQDLVPHQDGTLICRSGLFADHLVRLERRDGLPRIVIRRLSDGDEHRIAFDEAAYSLSLLGGYEFETTTLRFAYSSMTTPEQIYRLRHDRPRPVAAQDSRKCRAATTRTTMSPAAYSPPAMTARRFRSRSCSAEDTKLDGSRPAAALRLWLLRPRHPRVVQRIAPAAWSTGVSSMPSPTSAAAPNAAMAGTSPASASTREHVSRLHRRGGKTPR